MRRRLVTLPPTRPPGFGVLAPMVDLLTLLLVFLLLSWSADAPVQAGGRAFDLPASIATAHATAPVQVDITTDAFFIEGVRATGTAYYLNQEDDLIPELYDPLLQLGRPRLQIRAEASTPYRLVRKVLFTARNAGVEEIQIVARSRSSL